MCRNTVILIGTLAVMFAGGPTYAESWMLSLNGGAGIPMGSFGETFKLGPIGGVRLDYMASHKFAVGIDGSFIRNRGSSDFEASLTTAAGTPVTAKYAWLHGGAHLKYMFPMASESAISPFVLFGLGAYKVSEKIESQNPTYYYDNSGTRLGPSVGLGLMFKASDRVGIGVEGGLHGLWTDGYWREFISLQTGLTFRMGNADPTLGGSLSERQEPKPYTPLRQHGSAPKYETRYVNGTQFQIGTQGDLQVWMAVWKGDELQTMLYVINRSERTITFYPDQIQVEALRATTNGLATVPVKVFTAEEYEQKVRKRNSNAQLLAALGAAAHAMNSPDEGETYQTRGATTVSDRYGSPVGTMSHTGTIKRLPSAADRQAQLDRARAEGEALHAQLDASFQSVAQTLMRTHTLDSSTYYGGMVYSKKSGNDYVMTVPFGDTSFQFRFSFAK